ncbi:MAG: DNA topoisomerase IB [Blastocatellia bacterium]
MKNNGQSPRQISDASQINAARSAGLRYFSDQTPGLRRKRVGKGFAYYTSEGKLLKDPETLWRIKALAIPPAWIDVWICPQADGHLQATGRDSKGRKQYRYHARWRSTRDENKYERLLDFGQLLPLIRKKTERDLALPGLPRQKVLATVVRLLETTLIRVGNEEYARSNNSFGLTTMRDKHVKVNGSKIHFRFRGKSGIKHDIDLTDKQLARTVKQCRDLPGQELFQYLDENGDPQSVSSTEVNDYLREITDTDFTAKDFRTWAGTVLATLALQEFNSFTSMTQAKRHVIRAIENVAARLGNTPSVCRKCYIHPAIIETYLEGNLLEALQQRAEQELSRKLHRLQPEEAAVLALLQQRLKREVKQRRKAA